MQITIDDDTFHKWASERGYVRLDSVLAAVEMVGSAYRPNTATAPEPDVTFQKFVNGVTTTPPMPFSEEAAALEQPEDLKPAEPPLTDRQTIRLLGELFEHYGLLGYRNRRETPR
jgi:hypothetical protein